MSADLESRLKPPSGLGHWTKIVKKRNSGNITDVYITTPEKKKLKSGAELYKYILKHKKYWPVFDAIRINFEREATKGFSKWTKKLISFLKPQQNAGSMIKAKTIKLKDENVKNSNNIEKTTSPERKNGIREIKKQKLNAEFRSQNGEAVEVEMEEKRPENEKQEKTQKCQENERNIDNDDKRPKKRKMESEEENLKDEDQENKQKDIKYRIDSCEPTIWASPSMNVHLKLKKPKIGPKSMMKKYEEVAAPFFAQIEEMKLSKEVTNHEEDDIEIVEVKTCQKKQKIDEQEKKQIYKKNEKNLEVNDKNEETKFTVANTKKEEEEIMSSDISEGTDIEILETEEETDPLEEINFPDILEELDIEILETDEKDQLKQDEEKHGKMYEIPQKTEVINTKLKEVVMSSIFDKNNALDQTYNKNDTLQQNSTLTKPLDENRNSYINTPKLEKVNNLGKQRTDNGNILTYDILGTWTKIMKKRTSGNHVDVYITTPEKKRLRSGAELYKFIENNDKYWPVFDATLINFDKDGKQAPSKWTKSLITFLNEKQNGLSNTDSSQSVRNENEPQKKLSKIGPKSAMKSRHSLSPDINENVKTIRPKIGPKSMMKKEKDKELPTQFLAHEVFGYETEDCL